MKNIQPTYVKTSTEGLYSPRLIEEIIDEDNDRYKREMKFWWESLTKEEQIKEWSTNSDQLTFYVQNPND